MPRHTLLAWSSGKDSAWTLWRLRQDPEVEVVGLLTTMNAEADRVAMHAVRRDLLRAQARAAGLPVHEVELPFPCTDAQYEDAMRRACGAAVERGITHMAFGDLFLEDVRRYRVERLEGTGLEPDFPLWGADTGALAREMIAAGLRARITCLDPRRLDRSLAGRELDLDLLAGLPPDVDPCGENGEFHTFVTAGPMLTAPVEVQVGEVVERDGFVFADLRPAPPVPTRS
jgi:uncharacterized protein (TIGR00290 family)